MFITTWVRVKNISKVVFRTRNLWLWNVFSSLFRKFIPKCISNISSSGTPRLGLETPLLFTLHMFLNNVTSKMALLFDFPHTENLSK